MRYLSPGGIIIMGKTKTFWRNPFIIVITVAALLILLSGCGAAVGVNAAAEDTVTITFDLNGGTGTPPEAITVPNGTEVAIPDKTDDMKRKNAIFTCWNTMADGKGTNYYAGANASFTEDTTLYAKWDAGAQCQQLKGI